MLRIPEGMTLPRTLDDVDAAFMTSLLRSRGVIDEENHVVSTEDAGVGMTAGYFSAIKKVKCTYANPTDAADAFVVKTWPDLENAPKEQIAGMFAKDIAAYSMPEEGFYPRPKVYLADFDASEDRWALLMDDVNAFGDQKLHEDEMSFDEVMHMVPKLVEIAVAWEGCHEGERARQLDDLEVAHWASDENLAAFKQIMPGGARLFDFATSLPDSSLVQGRPWDKILGNGSIAALFTNKLEAFYDTIRPERGATCTLVHGDLRGDNLFFCPQTPDYPNGWLTIDFQLLTRGPIPSDLAYLMNSGSVLPEVYSGDNREKIMQAFFEAFMDSTHLYKDYTWEQFRAEYTVMATVLFVYYVGFGANIWQSGTRGELAARVEMGANGHTEADLAPEELRQRMWWRKAFDNFRTTFADFGFHEQLSQLPDNTGPVGPWFELPEHLKG
jgi:hypothetical protein